MKIKKYTIGITAMLLLLCSVAPSAAQTTLPAGNTLLRPLKTAVGSSSAGIKAEIKEDSLKNRGTTEIQRRIAALNELITRVNGLKHVSNTTKNTLLAQIQNEIASLTALQTKIQNDTDPVTLKTDVKSIIDSYRIFALFMPQVQLLSGADTLSNVSDKLASFSANLQARITQAGSAGQNVASLQSLLTSMQTEIANAKSQSAAITAEVSPLTPAGFPGNKSILQDARTRLQAGVKNLRTAGQNARQIIQGLFALGENVSPSSSNSGKFNMDKPQN